MPLSFNLGRLSSDHLRFKLSNAITLSAGYLFFSAIHRFDQTNHAPQVTSTEVYFIVSRKNKKLPVPLFAHLF